MTTPTMVSLKAKEEEIEQRTEVKEKVEAQLVCTEEEAMCVVPSSEGSVVDYSIFEKGSLKDYADSNGRPYPGVSIQFYPKDEDIVLYYLKMKMLGVLLPPLLIHDIDTVYTEHPQELLGKYSHVLNEASKKEWYFFTQCETENPLVQVGERESIGEDEKVVYEDLLVGFKKTLVFYKGGLETKWMMNEFRHRACVEWKEKPHTNDKLVNSVVSRIFKKDAQPQPEFGYEQEYEETSDEEMDDD